ncbi:MULTISPECIES: PP2C family protein-serine/threonine phosphatase [unclassified Providencia]|uniref:PP2C family protein-serine/threonine phosphatase n=1 Tax=unclassified Providencia TaxID=2633465 RepID=UPI0013DF46D5|nr:MULTISPECIES: protein phosphatase 2C domain-containing protein [unclassified Providencia]QIF56510.1 phosphatase 2C family protein [Providencia sp. 1701011]QIF60559.1 phosphatase 2C family protein [Providencia sp. 1701091]
MNRIIDISCFSEAAKGKLVNEDYFLPPTYDYDSNIVFAIADGVGSTEHADLASKSAIQAIQKLIAEPNFNIDKAFIYAKEAINKFGFSVATTLTIVHIVNSVIHVGHVGDCRLYFKNENKLIQLTKDHTKYQELLDSGEHSMRNLRNHKERLSTILTAALSNDIELQYDSFDKNILDIADKENVILTLMSDGAYKHWESRPRFSERTMGLPSAFSASLRRRIEKDIIDDYTFLSIKIRIHS